jgi:hypothetical protein
MSTTFTTLTVHTDGIPTCTLMADGAPTYGTGVRATAIHFDEPTRAALEWSEAGLRRALQLTLQRTQLVPLDLMRAWNKEADGALTSKEFLVILAGSHTRTHIRSTPAPSVHAVHSPRSPSDHEGLT